MKTPSFLVKNSTIGITAPSFGCTTQPYSSYFKSACRQIEERGYKIKTGKTVFMDDGKGISTDPKIAALELMEFYTSDDTQAIISAGGGEAMCETAAYIDFEALKDAKPKWFMGYSDNTNFIFPLATISGIASVYGPCISGFGKKWEQGETDAFRILEGTTKKVKGFPMFQKPENDISCPENPASQCHNLTEKKILHYFNCSDSCKMEGMLLGGCLDVLSTLCGTKLDNMKAFNSKADSVIWVLESCDANPMEIRRQVWQLKNSGWFEKASGFLVGRPLTSMGKEMMGVNQYNAVTDIIGKLGVPVIMDADIGHIDPAMPLVIGANSRILSEGNEISVEMDI